MTFEKISPAVQAIHESAARFVADSYLINLAKDADATFGTLEGLMMTFRSEIVAHVYRKAEIRGIHNIKFRDVILASLARAEIRTRLENNATLAQKLVSIRAKQKAKADAEISAAKSLAMDARSSERLLRERAAKCNKTAYGICRKKRLLSEARRCAAIALGFEIRAQQ